MPANRPAGRNLPLRRTERHGAGAVADMGQAPPPLLQVWHQIDLRRSELAREPRPRAETQSSTSPPASAHSSVKSTISVSRPSTRINPCFCRRVKLRDTVSTASPR